MSAYNAPMFYLVPRRSADALKGSRNALKSSPRLTIYGVFATAAKAAAYADARWGNSAQLVTAIVEL